MPRNLLQLSRNSVVAAVPAVVAEVVVVERADLAPVALDVAEVVKVVLVLVDVVEVAVELVDQVAEDAVEPKAKVTGESVQDDLAMMTSLNAEIEPSKSTRLTQYTHRTFDR